MAKFSKNGKPLGKVSQDGNRNKKWTAEEDMYLAIAVKEQIPVTQVANRLGRTKHAIVFRKHTIGLQGSFGRAERLKNPKPTSWLSTVTKNHAPVENQQEDPLTFVLETGIPLPARSRSNEEDKNRLRAIFDKMMTGQSFVVPRKMVHVAKHLANLEYEAYQLKTSCLSVDKKFFRIYRVA